MTDEERIEQLELEVKVLRANNKGLKDKIDEQSKEIEELKNSDLPTVYLNGFYDGEKKVKGKIKSKIEELEKEQEDNRKSLYNAVNNLNFKEIDKISNRICVNMTVRGILQSLLEEE